MSRGARAYIGRNMMSGVALRSLTLPAWAERALPVTFAGLVRDHQDEVYGLALRMLGDRDAALDVTSTVFQSKRTTASSVAPPRAASKGVVGAAEQVPVAQPAGGPFSR